MPAAARTRGLPVLAAFTALTGFACSAAAPGAIDPGPERAGNALSAAEITTIARILHLEDQRAYDDAAFRAFLDDASVEVRRRAVVAAGRTGDPEAIGLLLRALADDPTAAVRADAAFALGHIAQLGYTDDALIDGLAAAVRDGRDADSTQPSAVDVEAIAALGKAGGERAREVVLDVLTVGGTAPRHRALAAEALLTVWKFDDGPGNARAAAPYLNSDDPELRWRAAYALMRGGDPAAVPFLLGADLGGGRDGDHRARAYMARALTAAAADSTGRTADALEWLVGALDDEHPHVRVNVLRSLAGYGGGAPVDRVARRLWDPDHGVGVAAAGALGALAGSTEREGPVVREHLAAALSDRDLPVPLRGAALEQLVRLDPEMGARTVRQWAGRDPAYRYFAARAAVGLPPLPALELAATLVRDDEPSVAVAAVALAAAALDGDGEGASRTAAARQILDHALRSTYPVLRAAARADLAELREPNEASPTAVPDRLVEPPSEPRDRAFFEEVVRRFVAPPLAGGPRPRARVETVHGPITVELLAAEAPLTVHNFVHLADRGFFDGGVWHRVIPNFVLQDGAPGGHASGGPGWTIRDEINRVRYERGTLGMALSGPDTGGSQWFITHSPQPHLDGGYTVFGRVVDGMRAADAVLQGDRIHSIRVEP